METAAIVDLLHPPETRAGALWALGFSGRPLAADACLPWLGDSAVAKLAGEAFSNITGLKLEGPYVLPSTQPRQEPVPLEEEDLDADIAPRPEDDLPCLIQRPSHPGGTRSALGSRMGFVTFWATHSRERCFGLHWREGPCADDTSGRENSSSEAVEP